MKVCAVVCELNPFHNGHEYLFRTARSISGADFVVAIMSGDFTQRGLPAICDKYARAKMALDGGADLVAELPVIYATASADYFAQGAVSLASNMNIVTHLAFGSECGDLDMLRSCAGLREQKDPGLHILSQGTESESTRNYRISKLIREGSSYAKAYAEVTGNSFAPNDMLAVRYIRSLDMTDSAIEPVCIKRVGGGYNSSGSDDLSAISVRRKVMAREPYAHLIPKYVYRTLESVANVSFPVYPKDFSIQMYSITEKIIQEEKSMDAYLTDFMDVSPNIAGRIRSNITKFTDHESFAGQVHSKEYTKSRIYRALLHIMLDIKKTDYPEDIEDISSPYVRILGFRKGSSALLAQLKEACVIPVISKAGDAASILDDEAMYLFDKDIRAANLYDMACVFKFKKEPAHDFTREVVIV